MGTDYKVRIDDKEYTPQEISALILKKLKKTPRNISVVKLKRQLLLVQLTSTTLNDKPPKRLVS